MHSRAVPKPPRKERAFFPRLKRRGILVGFGDLRQARQCCQTLLALLCCARHRSALIWLR